MSNWSKLIGAALMLLALVSCRSNVPNLKPATEPEAYNLPPSLPKYAKPFEYPLDVRHQDPFAKQRRAAAKQKGGAGMGPRPGGGSGPR